LASNAPLPAFISVVVTVKNEERHLRRLLDSLLVQEGPFEVVVVDALSRDKTPAIAEEFSRRFPDRVRFVQQFGSRGIGRNHGVQLARGEFVAFIDGDCLADSNWLKSLRQGLGEADVAAGRTVIIGPTQYAGLERVELYQRGSDVTFPSCNLAYRKRLFERLGGFDGRFITAEDIDLNLRAVRAGASIHYVPEAIVFHSARANLVRFLYQALWNGYGRKQLTEKHGSLWGSYRPQRFLERQRGPIAYLRVFSAFVGYFFRKFTAGSRRLGDNPSGESESVPSERGDRLEHAA
jgi:glycosyltransferase involved in cell wall biosynthesis